MLLMPWPGIVLFANWIKIFFLTKTYLSPKNIKWLDITL